MKYFLTSARLGFRCWTEADRSLAFALWTDPEVMGHMGGAMSSEAAEARFALEMERQRKFGYQYWPMFLLDGGEHAGCAGLRPFHDSSQVLEIGVYVARPYWSLRLGEEAARAVIGYVWQTTEVEALVAGHGPNNTHSQALLKRLGFCYTHHELWGPHQTMHPYYRLERPL